METEWIESSGSSSSSRPSGTTSATSSGSAFIPSSASSSFSPLLFPTSTPDDSDVESEIKTLGKDSSCPSEWAYMFHRWNNIEVTQFPYCSILFESGNFHSLTWPAGYRPRSCHKTILANKLHIVPHKKKRKTTERHDGQTATDHKTTYLLLQQEIW